MLFSLQSTAAVHSLWSANFQHNVLSYLRQAKGTRVKPTLRPVFPCSKKNTDTSDRQEQQDLQKFIATGHKYWAQLNKPYHHHYKVPACSILAVSLQAVAIPTPPQSKHASTVCHISVWVLGPALKPYWQQTACQGRSREGFCCCGCESLLQAVLCVSPCRLI